MNERDLYRAEQLMEEISGHRNSAMFIFNTKFTQIGKTNLLLLKGLLDIEGESGFFVVLDRPHQYMSYLLRMHKVNQKNLWFIDGVTHTSGLEREERDNVNFLEGPFHIETLFDNMEFGGMGVEKGFLSPESVDFFLIDNIASMLNYNEVNRVESFIISFSDFIKTHSHIMGGVTIDKESNPELSEILMEHFDYMIDTENMNKEAEIWF